MRWSDQVFEITGLEQDGALVSLGDLRALLRRSDRTRIEQAIGRLVETHGTSEFDHEIVRPDGAVRYVHHILAWAPADERAGDRLVGTMLDITDRKQLELQLRYQAYHDGLTGLPNRELFLERLSDCLTVGRGRNNDKGVIFLDLDYFKQINDRFGHESGDAVLIEVARRLERHTSSCDTVARLSGDEFTILVCNEEAQDRIITLADELLQAVQKPVHVHGETIPMTASAGLVYITDRHQSPSDVLREADNALYRAKGAGRNRLSVETADTDNEEPTALRTPA
jgi:diguanylate cyclase (GGDEF)-like protein